MNLLPGGIIMYGALILFEDEFIHIVAISFSALILTELVMVALTIRTWHRLMVLAEIFSLLLYLISLAVFHEYFGMMGMDCGVGGLLILCLFLLRLGIHLVVRFRLESVYNYGGLLLTTLFYQVLEEEMLPTIVLEVVVSSPGPSSQQSRLTLELYR